MLPGIHCPGDGSGPCRAAGRRVLPGRGRGGLGDRGRAGPDARPVVRRRTRAAGARGQPVRDDLSERRAVPGAPRASRSWRTGRRSTCPGSATWWSAAWPCSCWSGWCAPCRAGCCGSGATCPTRTPTTPTTPAGPRSPEELAAAVAADRAAQLAAVQEGTPRNGVVAAWSRLEEIAAETGLARQRWETSAEFTARMLAGLPVDAAAAPRAGHALPPGPVLLPRADRGRPRPGPRGADRAARRSPGGAPVTALGVVALVAAVTGLVALGWRVSRPATSPAWRTPAPERLSRRVPRRPALGAGTRRDRSPHLARAHQRARPPAP